MSYISFVTPCTGLYMQVWDRRTLGRNPKPAGLFVGHTDGMTHLDPKGDGRYLISNCKDHTVKLWDLRNMMAPGAYNPRAAKDAGCEFSWYAHSRFVHQHLPPLPLAGVSTWSWDHRSYCVDSYSPSMPGCHQHACHVWEHSCSIVTTYRLISSMQVLFNKKRQLWNSETALGSEHS